MFVVLAITVDAQCIKLLVCGDMVNVLSADLHLTLLLSAR